MNFTTYEHIIPGRLSSPGEEIYVPPGTTRRLDGAKLICGHGASRVKYQVITRTDTSFLGFVFNTGKNVAYSIHGPETLFPANHFNLIYLPSGAWYKCSFVQDQYSFFSILISPNHLTAWLDECPTLHRCLENISQGKTFIVNPSSLPITAPIMAGIENTVTALAQSEATRKAMNNLIHANAADIIGLCLTEINNTPLPSGTGVISKIKFEGRDN
jgi:hypothetical protein